MGTYDYENLDLMFLGSENYGFLYSFRNKQYFVRGCTYWTDFPTDLNIPSETDKVWTIFLSRTSEVRRMVVFCNEVEILNMVMSESNCKYKKWEEQWIQRDVTRIGFSQYDKASDYYRIGENYFIFSSQPLDTWASGH